MTRRGRVYFVAISENDPKSISMKMLSLGFAPKVLVKRQAGSELLFVIRFTLRLTTSTPSTTTITK